MTQKENIYLLARRIKGIATAVAAQNEQEATYLLDGLSFGVDPAFIEQYSQAILAVTQHKDDSEMLEIIADGLIENATKNKGGI
jgi:hypothetical protein